MRYFGLSILAISILASACSNDKTSPTGPDNTATSTWVEDGGYWSSLVDASSDTETAYFSFATMDTVTLTDEQAADDDSWDISFKRYYVNLNGGLTGTKGVVAVDLASVGAEDSISFNAVTDTSDMVGNDWTSDNYVYAVDEWYLYTGPPNHDLVPTNNVYVLRDAEGSYVKFQVIGLDGGFPPDMGSVTCRFVYAASGADISGTPDTVTIDVGAGTGYLDFSSAMEVMPADPMNSTDWDIAFTNYEIHLNSGYFGPGEAAAYPVFQDLDDPTDFDGLTQAVTIDNAYFIDEIGSAFTDWYNYIHEPYPTLPSKEHVYLIKVDGSVFKLQIQSYYHPDLGSSGWFTFRWAELEL